MRTRGSACESGTGCARQICCRQSRRAGRWLGRRAGPGASASNGSFSSAALAQPGYQLLQPPEQLPRLLAGAVICERDTARTRTILSRDAAARLGELSGVSAIGAWQDSGFRATCVRGIIPIRAGKRARHTALTRRPPDIGRPVGRAVVRPSRLDLRIRTPATADLLPYLPCQSGRVSGGAPVGQDPLPARRPAGHNRIVSLSRRSCGV